MLICFFGIGMADLLWFYFQLVLWSNSHLSVFRRGQFEYQPAYEGGSMHIECGIYFYSLMCWAAAAICPFSVVGSVEYQSTFEGGCIADLL
jgi:hypothetical protein